MSLIPFEFTYQDEDADPYFMEHLCVEKNDGLNVITWPYFDEKICHTDDIVYPDLENVEAHTPAFTNHLNFGFSLGDYSEFFVAENYYLEDHLDFAAFTFGQVTVSVGNITPLAQYLYYGKHDSHYHPDMDDIMSIRILGAGVKNIESILLYTIIKLRKDYKFIFRLFDFFDVDEVDEVEPSFEERKELENRDFRNPVKDLEPLRFFYKGVTDDDHSNAFLQFYRVLEYYSIIQFHDNISDLRWEKDLSTNKFILEVQKIFSKDERGAICKLIATISDPSMIMRAFKSDLVENNKIDVFANSLYNFRNSLVHAKYDQRSTILSESIFSPHTKVEQWRKIIEDLSFKAIELYGTRNT